MMRMVAFPESTHSCIEQRRCLESPFRKMLRLWSMEPMRPIPAFGEQPRILRVRSWLQTFAASAKLFNRLRLGCELCCLST